MIRDAEIRRDARAAGVEPRIIELDYALGWALRGIARHPELARRLVFKGGTCLRKCYFPDYRFSEDLDFTATQWFAREEFEEAVAEAFADVLGAERDGPASSGSGATVRRSVGSGSALRGADRERDAWRVRPGIVVKPASLERSWSDVRFRTATDSPSQ